MQDITILHVSDLHMRSKCEGDIRIVVNSFFRDLEKIRREENVKIDFVCFTGDLIQRGDLSEQQFPTAMEHFIQPLLELLGLDQSRLFIIPGNHDVDRSMVDKYMESGLQKELNSRDKVNYFIDHDLDPVHTKRLSEFYKFRDQYFNIDFQSAKLGTSYIRQHGQAKIGFACLNSAWRCSGDQDKGKLIVSERQVDDTYSSISSCDIKVALMHHPLGWLADHDQRAVRDVLTKFDLVLTGHEHDLSEHEMVVDGKTTMYCACGSLFAGRGPFNGYSVIKINPLTKSGEILVREYFDSPRRVFGATERLFDHGKHEFILSQGDACTDRVRKYTASLAYHMGEFVSETLMSRMVDETAPSGVEELYVPPTLSKNSEYMKESMDDGTSNLDTLISKGNNLVLIGKREIGKTTMLGYVALQQVQNYSIGGSAPFIIDVGKLGTGLRQIQKQMSKFVHEVSQDEFHFSTEQIDEMLERGLCTLLFDNIEVGDGKRINVLKSFVEKYPKNRFLFTVNESIFNAIDADDIPYFGCEVETWYIKTFDRQQVRSLIGRWFAGHDISIDDMVERTMSYLSRIGLPRTPLVLSMFFAIYKRDRDYVPVNESSVMERFMEMVLEKMSPSETRIGAFDYRSKEKFLSELAWYMLENKKYPLPINEFHEFTISYFKGKGLNLHRSKFDKIFFDKKVLVIDNGDVYFRYRSMYEYHIAVKAIKDPKVLEYVLSDEHIFSSGGIIGFMTGLERDRLDILTRVQDVLSPLIQEHVQHLRELDNYNLGLDFQVDTEELAEQMEQSVLSDEERDQVLNVPDRYQNFEEQKVQVISQELSGFDKLYNLTMIYGRLLRNSDDFTIETKTRTFKSFCLALCIVWGEAKARLESSLLEGEENETDKDLISNIIKVTLPIVLQNIASETVGTPNLDEAIEACIPQEINALDFMIVSLYSDLKMKDFLAVVNSYIERETSKDLLRILSFKLMYYYQTRFVDKALSRMLAETLANCVIKLNGLSKQFKGNIVQSIERDYDRDLFLKRYLG